LKGNVTERSCEHGDGLKGNERGTLQHKSAGSDTEEIATVPRYKLMQLQCQLKDKIVGFCYYGWK